LFEIKKLEKKIQEHGKLRFSIFFFSIFLKQQKNEGMHIYFYLTKSFLCWELKEKNM